jgi:hypothetical protein
MKEIAVEDFNLTPDEMKLVVSMFQRLMVPDHEPVDRTPDSGVDKPEKPPTST